VSNNNFLIVEKFLWTQRKKWSIDILMYVSNFEWHHDFFPNKTIPNVKIPNRDWRKNPKCKNPKCKNPKLGLSPLPQLSWGRGERPKLGENFGNLS
jgi:hypothetical protein